uniref:Uncharacterized protein n=1 Tax=Anguilla anguilla TaxID=7936 RepID=A0A0E9UUQ6_ANGAN
MQLSWQNATKGEQRDHIYKTGTSIHVLDHKLLEHKNGKSQDDMWNY